MVEASPVSAPQAATVRVGDPSPASALRLGLLFAAITLGLQTASNLWQAHIGYGYFRDELYYILCGRHLAWGYVDHGPLVAVQARLAIVLFGRSLAGIRMLSAAAGAASVFLTGILCWALGGRRPAQALAMLCVLIAPIYLGTGSYLSMNSQSVEVVGRMGTTYSMPYEHRNIYLARGRKASLLADWPAMKEYI